MGALGADRAAAKSGLLGHIPQSKCGTFGEGVMSPWFEGPVAAPGGDVAAGLESTAYAGLEYLNTLPMQQVTVDEETRNALADGYVEFVSAEAKGSPELRLQYTMAVNDNLNPMYHRGNGFTALPAIVLHRGQDLGKVLQDKLTFFGQSRLQLLSMLSEAWVPRAAREATPVLGARCTGREPRLRSESGPIRTACLVKMRSHRSVPP